MAASRSLRVPGRICELANGTAVSPGSLLEWLDDAWVERVVFDGPSRVIDVGVSRRRQPRGAALEQVGLADGIETPAQ